MVRKLCNVLSICFLFYSTPVEAEPVRVGALFHLTGEFAAQGNAFQEGVQLALDEINAGERKIDVVFEDTKYLPVETNTGAKRLSELNVSAVLISTYPEAKTASPVLTQQKIPMLVLWDSSPELEELSEYLFGIGPWTPGAGEISAGFIIQHLKMRKAVVLNSNTEWSLSVSEYFSKRLKELGGEVVKTFTFNPGEQDFLTVLTKVRLLHPEVLFAPMDSSLVPFFSQIKKLHLDMPVVTTEIITEDNLQEAADAFEGVYQSSPADPALPATAEMLRLYQIKYGRPATQTVFIAWAYDATKLLGEVVNKGASNSETIRSALLSTRDFKGAGGSIDFSKGRSSPRIERMFQVKGGKFVPVE